MVMRAGIEAFHSMKTGKLFLNGLQRRQSWREKFLSPASIPSYVMFVFFIPKTLYDEIHSVIPQFWWSSKEKERGICWRKCDDLCKRWWILESQDSVLSKVLQGKYFPHKEFLSALLGHRPSLSWQSIWEARRLLKEGLR
ncbi:hypothetical protein M9H77_22496 [Catharanthus roseus]|uniref:Uncharacterized protein n=1 Tax=Catharanthus roseus TaxID=4058 RepID=A0ACC0AUP6_CATRO|nr:hypothetical protein M9H77_22496 [Catharanthus roseus]